MKELNTQLIMGFVENYTSNWKNHFLHMPCLKILSQILHYQPQG